MREGKHRKTFMTESDQSVHVEDEEVQQGVFFPPEIILGTNCSSLAGCVCVFTLTGPHWVVVHLPHGCWLHSRVMEGLLPAPRQCWLPTSLHLLSGPFVQRTRLVWDPPPQLAEQGDHASTRHLEETQRRHRDQRLSQTLVEKLKDAS